ncbi:MAG: DUF192 domain-containing protein [Pseudomonadota bacterium]
MDLRGEGGAAARFAVEVADTPETRSRGLMFRESMPRSAGMLFIFDPPREVAFWMKNTPLPLDLIFFDEAGQVIRVSQGVPFSEDRIPSGGVVRAVLEVNEGLMQAYGLGVGAEARHPAFAQGDPAWPC